MEYMFALRRVQTLKEALLVDVIMVMYRMELLVLVYMYKLLVLFWTFGSTIFLKL